MRELRLSETSNSAMIELMSRFALDENGVVIGHQEFIGIIDDLDTEEFAQLTIDFNNVFVSKMRSSV